MPHCKKALPEWNGFSQANHGKDLYGYRVNCVDINCTNEDDSKVVEYINKFNIDSYPTVKMIKDGKTIAYTSAELFQNKKIVASATATSKLV